MPADRTVAAIPKRPVHVVRLNPNQGSPLFFFSIILSLESIGIAMRVSRFVLVAPFPIAAVLQVGVAAPIPKNATPIALAEISTSSDVSILTQKIPDVAERERRVVSAKFLSQPPLPSNNPSPHRLVQRDEASTAAVSVNISVVYVLIGVIGVLCIVLGSVVTVLTILLVRIRYQQCCDHKKSPFEVPARQTPPCATSNLVDDQSGQHIISKEQDTLPAENVQKPTTASLPNVAASSNASAVSPASPSTPQKPTEEEAKTPLSATSTAFSPVLYQSTDIADGAVKLSASPNPSPVPTPTRKRMPNILPKADAHTFSELAFTPLFSSTPVLRARRDSNASEITLDLDLDTLNLEEQVEESAVAMGAQDELLLPISPRMPPLASTIPSPIAPVVAPVRLPFSVRQGSRIPSSSLAPRSSSRLLEPHNALSAYPLVQSGTSQPSPAATSFAPPMASTSKFMPQDLSSISVDIRDLHALPFPSIPLATNKEQQPVINNPEPSLISIETKDRSYFPDFDISAPETGMALTTEMSTPLVQNDSSNRRRACHHPIEDDSLFIVSLPEIPSGYAVDETDWSGVIAQINLSWFAAGRWPRAPSNLAKDSDKGETTVKGDGRKRDDGEEDQPEVGRAGEPNTSNFDLSGLPNGDVDGSPDLPDASYLDMPFVHRKPPNTVAELMQAIESLDGMVAETEAWAEQPVPEIRDSFDWDYKHHLIMNAELMIDENFMDENLDGVGDVSFMEKGGFVPPFSVAVAHHNSAKGKERCA